VSSEMPCMQEHNMMSEMSMSGSHFDNMAVDENSEDCCPKDCCCPMGLLIVAVLVDSRLNGCLTIPRYRLNQLSPQLKKRFSIRYSALQKLLSTYHNLQSRQISRAAFAYR
jgi:hypothetical protein